MKWNQNQIDDLEEDINKLLGKGLSVDGRFSYYSDAEYFYNTYFSDVDCIIVSVSMTEEYYNFLVDELVSDPTLILGELSGDIDKSELLGFDIIGWDSLGFNTLISDFLHENLPDATFSDIGLLTNDYEKVVEFTKQIQNSRDDIDWIPCRIGQICF